jgi:ABC-2 type transport system permease protein
MDNFFNGGTHPYIAGLSARMRTLLQYRASALAGLGTQLFWGIMRVMIFTAFYRSSVSRMPMTLQETITYIWLGQALLLLMPWNIDREIQEMISSGNVVYELVKPVDPVWWWFSRALAMRTAPALLRSVPMFVVAGFFLGLRPPESAVAALAFAVSVLCAVLLSSAITVCMHISLFWTLSGQGMIRLMPSLAMIFSGLIVPLPFFPEWSQPIISAMPFRGIMDIPFRLYMGHIPVSQAADYIMQQIAWVIVILLLARTAMGFALKRIVIHGG